MSTHAFVPILGKRLRVTTVDSAGNLHSGSRKIVTEGFVTASLTADVEDGTEILQRNASGNICVNERMPNSFKRFEVEMELCGVQPELVTMMTHADPYEDYAGDVAGFTVSEGEIDEYFALEIWTGLSGASDSEAGGYFLLPFIVGGSFGDLEIDGENAVNLTITGAGTKGGNGWGTGPYDVLRNEEGEAGPLPTALDPYDHLLLIDTALAPPAITTDGSEEVNGGVGT